MTPRQRTILRLALTYLNSNLDAASEAMATTGEYSGSEAGKLSFNGDLIDPPTEEEIDGLLLELQG